MAGVGDQSKRSPCSVGNLLVVLIRVIRVVNAGTHNHVVVGEHILADIVTGTDPVQIRTGDILVADTIQPHVGAVLEGQRRGDHVVVGSNDFFIRLLSVVVHVFTHVEGTHGELLSDANGDTAFDKHLLIGIDDRGVALDGLLIGFEILQIPVSGHTQRGVDVFKVSGGGETVVIVRHHRVEPEFVVGGDHIQRVNDLDIQGTVTDFVGRVVQDRVVGVTEHDLVAVFIVAVGKFLGKQQGVDASGGEVKLIATVADTDETGDGRFVAIVATHHSTIDDLVRNSGVAGDVLTTFEVRLHLTIEAILRTRLLGVFHEVVVGVGHSHEVIGLVVDQGGVGTAGELVFSDHKAVGDTGIAAIDLQ